MKKLLVLSIYLLAVLALTAQEMTVRAPGRVDVGQRFEVRYEVNARASDFRGPNFKGFSVLSGPNASHMSSTQIINGQISSSITTGFTYIIQADIEGSYNVGSASCNVDGKRVTCQGFSIKVEKGNPNAQQQNARNAYGQPQRQQSQRATQPAQSDNIDSRSLFARASISKSNPYQGEQVILTYKIYTQVSLQQYQIDKLPGNKGFWSEDLTKDGSVKQYEETVDGRRYMVAEIRRGALFAQESGKLTIEPLDLDVLALVQRQRQRTGSIWDLFDDPFFNPTQAIQKHLRTNSINVNVKPLPNAPEGFNGAVGTFTVTRDVDTREVRANEAITYRLTISGNGNLMLIDAPQIDFPKVFEVYDPQIDDHITRSSSGVSGSRTFEWVLIPRKQGDYEIPAFNFVTFDPSAGRYVTKHVEAIPVHIKKGDPKSMKNVTSNKSDVKLLNSDINHIRTSTGGFSPRTETARPAWWFWTLLIAIIAAGIGAILFFRHRLAQQQDIAGMRLRRATKEARKRLKKAASHLNDGNDNLFYEEIYKAIWGCLADKYNIELSRLSSDTVRECLTEKQVPEEQQKLIMSTLQEVDFARFAPGDATAKKQQIYDQALQMIVML
ncbi:MAG: protein BatD [Bacteroidales bacterium]|nr:protein BatD [Bacteroidales bacterium]